MWCFFFFFFQAEDGIRDLTVTGVQTCALPISAWCWGSNRSFQLGTLTSEFCGSARAACSTSPIRVTGRQRFQSISAGLGRSEERRVGKECRFRWSPYQLKKKKYEDKLSGLAHL